MFDKLLRKLDQVKEEVFDEANKHMETVGRNVRGGVEDAINGKKSEFFSSIFEKITETTSSSFRYINQVEKLSNEKRAKELGISSRELKSMSIEEIANKYGMSVEEYHNKVSKEAEQYNNKTSVTDGLKEMQKRARKEAEVREQQVAVAGLTLEAFDELTLQEQADKLDLPLDVLLDQRGLKF